MIVTKTILEKLVADNKIKQLIEILLSLRLSDAQLSHEIISLSRRFNAYEKEKNGDSESSDKLATEINKIGVSALYLISKIPDNELETKTNELKTKTNDMENKTLQELVQKLYRKLETQEQEKTAHIKKEKEMKELIDASTTTLFQVIEKIKDGALESLGVPAGTLLGKLFNGMFGKSKKSEKLLTDITAEGKLELTAEEFENEVLEIARNDAQFAEQFKGLFKSREIDKLKSNLDLRKETVEELEELKELLPTFLGTPHFKTAQKQIDTYNIQLKSIDKIITKILEKNGLSL